MYKPNKIIVVGGNAAGPSAAAKAKRINPSAEVILFEASEFISTGTCELPYILSGEIENYEKIVFFTPDTFLKEKGVKVFTNSVVKFIDRKRRKIVVLSKLTNTSNEFYYDKLILTAGSRANEIPNLPFSTENVFSLKNVQDYIKIKNHISTNEIKNILVVGSGYIGLEISDAFNKSGYNVTILEKEKLPMPSADEEIQHLIKSAIENTNIKFLSGDDQVKFIILNNKFSQLKFDSRYIDFDMAVVAAGVSPNVMLAEEAKLRIGSFGGLIVDSKLKTSDPNIYAAGDIVEVKNVITKKNDYIPLATNAHSYGHIAGENAAGGNKIADPILLNSAFKFCNNFIAQVGLTQKQAEDVSYNVNMVTAVAYNKVRVMPNSAKVFGKVIFDKYSGLILGASFVGSEEVSGYADIIATMIQNNIPAKKLSKTNFNYTPPLSPFVNLLSILGRKIEENK